MLKSEDALSCPAEPGVMEFDYLHNKSGNRHKSFLIGQGRNPQGMGSNVSLTGGMGLGQRSLGRCYKALLPFGSATVENHAQIDEKSKLGTHGPRH